MDLLLLLEYEEAGPSSKGLNGLVEAFGKALPSRLEEKRVGLGLF